MPNISDKQKIKKNVQNRLVRMIKRRKVLTETKYSTHQYLERRNKEWQNISQKVGETGEQSYF